VRSTLERDAACRQGIAGPQCLDDVGAMAAICCREMHPDIGRNAQVQVVLSAPAAGVWDNDTGHETGFDRYNPDSLFASTGHAVLPLLDIDFTDFA
jgi:hypothetical protein